MKKSYYLSMTFNNIVFKGRNQAYGAYMLRKNYSKHMSVAAIIATALFSGALVGPLVQNLFFAEKSTYVKPVYEIIEPITIELPVLPPPPVLPKEEAAPPVAEKQVATEQYTDMRVVADNTKIETSIPPDQDVLSKVNIGTNTLDGELPEVPGATLDETPPAGMGTGAGDAVTTAPAEFIYVEEMPAFEGGEKALFKYLSKKMRYPGAAQQAGVEGIVVVTFVVAPDGAITKAEVVKRLGYGTDEEALRVINGMPHWKPGKQNGKTVPVRFTLPIRFSIK